MIILQENDLTTQQKKTVAKLSMKVHMTKGVANVFSKLSNFDADLDEEAGKRDVPLDLDITLNLKRVESIYDDEEPLKWGLINGKHSNPVNADKKPNEEGDRSHRIDGFKNQNFDPTQDIDKHDQPAHITK